MRLPATKPFAPRSFSLSPLCANDLSFVRRLLLKQFGGDYRIVEVPIRYEARSMAEGKKIRWTDGVSAIWTLLKWRVTKY